MRLGIELIQVSSHSAQKICSKIIVAQFCIVLLNKDASGPNANVNMEYGLILGHNKYVIPFQRRDETLPFNVAGLDTVKYDQGDFRRRAVDAIDQAIKETTQDRPADTFGSTLSLFLLIRNATVVNIQNSNDERVIFELGVNFGFNLLLQFDGLSYIFLGNFSALNSRQIMWRVGKLFQLISARLSSIPLRITAGLTTDTGLAALRILLERLSIWLVVPGAGEAGEVREWLSQNFPTPLLPMEIFTMKDVEEMVSALPATS